MSHFINIYIYRNPLYIYIRFCVRWDKEINLDESGSKKGGKVKEIKAGCQRGQVCYEGPQATREKIHRKKNV